MNPKNTADFRKEVDLKELYKRLKEKYKLLKTIVDKLGCPRETIYSIINRHHCTNVIVARKISKLSNNKCEKTIEKIRPKFSLYGSCIYVKDFPIKASPEIASLVGHSFGDGHTGQTFSYTNKNPELIDEIIKNVNSLPIRNMTLNNWYHKGYTIRFSTLVRDILLIFGAIRGNKVLQESQIPKWIKKGNKKIKSNFIRALFDDEGWANTNKRELCFVVSKNITFEDNLLNFLHEIKTILNDLEVNGITITKNRYNKGKNGKTLAYNLRICGFNNFIRFRENIGLTSSKKKEDLNNIINNTKHIKLNKKERDDMILNLLKKKPLLKAVDISKATKMTHKGVLGKLKEMEKNNLVVRHRLSHKNFRFKWSLSKWDTSMSKGTCDGGPK